MCYTPRMRRFWSKVRKQNGCWLWTAGISTNGYGLFKFNGRHTGAHRVAWMLTKGRIPKSRFVCHICDIKPCVRPSHLWLGTPQDNKIDSSRKGRWRGGRPTRLSYAQATKIRAVPRVYGSGVRLARYYGVSPMVISSIRCGKSWLIAPHGSYGNRSKNDPRFTLPERTRPRE